MLQTEIKARHVVIKLTLNWIGFLVFFALAGDLALNLILSC